VEMRSKAPAPDFCNKPPLPAAMDAHGPSSSAAAFPSPLTCDEALLPPAGDHLHLPLGVQEAALQLLHLHCQPGGSMCQLPWHLGAAA
jgi:hypothetical protein